jgi:hypothetical protein
MDASWLSREVPPRFVKGLYLMHGAAEIRNQRRRVVLRVFVDERCVFLTKEADLFPLTLTLPLIQFLSQQAQSQLAELRILRGDFHPAPGLPCES